MGFFRWFNKPDATSPLEQDVETTGSRLSHKLASGVAKRSVREPSQQSLQPHVLTRRKTEDSEQPVVCGEPLILGIGGAWTSITSACSKNSVAATRQPRRYNFHIPSLHSVEPIHPTRFFRNATVCPHRDAMGKPKRLYPGRGSKEGFASARRGFS